MRGMWIPLLLAPAIAVASPDTPKEAEVKRTNVAVLTVSGMS